MHFASYEFIGFLAVVFLLYYTVPKKIQWMLLLAASLVFYFFAGPSYLIFISVTTLSAYAVSIIMAKISNAEAKYLADNKEKLSKEERKAYKAQKKKNRLSVLIVGLTVNFGILAVLKYAGFFVVNLNSFIASAGGQTLQVPSLILPMGISFYTFQTMGYLFDVYRQKAEAVKNPAKLALFVSFFPQLVQGPISRIYDLAPQFFAPHSFKRKNFVFGIQRILWGFFKKLVIADRILVMMKTLAGEPDQYTGIYVFLLIVFYSIEIYCDFSGGIDITIGIAEALDIKLRENFIHPFMSKSTKEYWNRWHITMGSWFTDYVYYPLSVSRPLTALTKKFKAVFGGDIGKRVPVYLATIITWFLTGLWHGAGWNFIVWGLLNALIILVSREFEPLYKKFHARFPDLAENRFYSFFMMARTFLLMGLIRSLDVYRDVGLTFRLWGSMFTKPNAGEIFSGKLLDLGLGGADFVILAVSLAVLFSVTGISAKINIRERLYGRHALSWFVFGALFVSVILLGAYGVGYDAAQFIYNQF